MKVYILTEGGKNFGFGHITRCIALYQAFEEKNIIPHFIISGDKSISKFVEDKNCQIFDWIKYENKLFKIISDANIVVIDSYLADKSLYDRVSNITDGKLVMIDDYKRLNYPKGTVVNPSIYGDKIKYPKKNGINYLLGNDFIILRKDFWNVPFKKISKEAKNILITFGGINHSDLIDKIINHIKKYFNFKFSVVDNKNKVDAKGMLKLILEADICISGGGQTTYELARCGVPTIGICFADNQLFNLNGLSNIGFLKFVGWHNKKNLLEKIEKTIKELDRKKRYEMSKTGQKIVDGKGVKRIVQKILEI